jgi:hypothetical protein
MKQMMQYNYSILKFLLLLLAVVGAAPLYAQHGQADKVHFGLVYPLSTHGSKAPQDTNSFSLHILSGISAAEEGFSFSGISTIVKGDAKGLQFAGLSNHIGGKSEGMLFAGFANTYKAARGMQFAGFSNVSAGNVKGAQFGGFLNKAAAVEGAQFAGFANVATKVKGPQFAGFSNTATQIEGPQFAGFANIVADSVAGPQIAGFINVAKDINGSQFAGFINIARKVKGAQIAGFINIADSSDTPIGLINMIRTGEKSMGASIDDQLTSLITFRSGGKILYGIIGAGYNFENEEERYAFEAGIGAHFFNGPRFRINAELASVCLESFEPGEYFKTSLRILPAVKIANKIEVYAGAAINHVSTNTIEGKSLTRHYLHSWNNRRGNGFDGFYIGYMGGINFLF